MTTTASGLRGDHLVTFPNVPVFCNVLWPSREEALGAETGDIELVHDRGTDLVANQRYDPTRTAYSASYENSLDFSPSFRSYAEDLAVRLVEHAHLDGGRVLEIGPGDGSFLELCCTKSGSTGIGYDPSHDRAATSEHRGDWEIVTESFPFGEAVDADLVVCRHVLEHVDNPAELLAALRKSVEATAPMVYLEVPDATYMAQAPAVWDVIYEHCWYFTESALTGLMNRCGFEIVDSGRSFGDQYLWVEARPGPVVDHAPVTVTDFSSFGAMCREEIRRWDRRIESIAPGASIALWGAGSKGASFLNAVPSAHRVGIAVDLNPRKHGKYVPVSGQRVVAPSDLPDYEISHVIVLNPVYTDEIASSLATLGLRAEVLAA